MCQYSSWVSRKLEFTVYKFTKCSRVPFQRTKRNRISPGLMKKLMPLKLTTVTCRKLLILWWIWSKAWRRCEWIKRSAAFWARSSRLGYSSTGMRWVLRTQSNNIRLIRKLETFAFGSIFPTHALISRLSRFRSKDSNWNISRKCPKWKIPCTSILCFIISVTWWWKSFRTPRISTQK